MGKFACYTFHILFNENAIFRFNPRRVLKEFVEHVIRSKHNVQSLNACALSPIVLRLIVPPFYPVSLYN